MKRKGAATRHLDAGNTITSQAENDLLRWEEGYADLTPEAIQFAWKHWFRSAARRAS